MPAGLDIAFFGSSLVSAYWNGAATYYRGIIRALHERGHRITFYEPAAYDRQKHRDIPDPDWARIVVYPAERDEDALATLEQAARADLIVKASGVGVFDALLEAAVPEVRRAGGLAVFWDVDAPATLERLRQDPRDPFHACLGRYDLVLTYGGGDPVVGAYRQLGARACIPIYNALDPDTHHPVPPDHRFEADLSFLGNRLPDREARVDAFFLEAARRLPGRRFLLGGSGWQDKQLPEAVRYVGHVYTRDHNAFNCTPQAVLNISRESMARFGFSPATRVFEAAGAGACLITDAWEGIELFLEPDREVLVASSGEEVAELMAALTPAQAKQIGEAGRARVLAEHTYGHRADQLDAMLRGSAAGGPSPGAKQERPAPEPVSERRSRQAPPVESEIGNASPRGGAMNIVILGLSITSSWGNGHATTYRGLVRGLAAHGHRVLFLERDVPWYRSNRDLPDPPYGTTRLYASLEELQSRFAEEIRSADLVIVGSYVPEGVAVGEWVTGQTRGVTAFYDIDTPITLAAIERGDCQYLAPHLIPRFNLYLTFTGGPTLERLEREYGSPMARPLYCSVDPELYYPEPRPLRWDLGYLGTYSADRQPPLDRLLIEPARASLPCGTGFQPVLSKTEDCGAGLQPVGSAAEDPGRARLRFVVAGPQYPPSIDWPPNVERIEHLAPADHRGFYNAQRFTLNITRAEMIRAGYSPSVRLFEAAACGVPIISDAWPGLDTFFEPGREILISRCPEDTLRFLTEMSEEERLAIGRRARERVMSSHTARHRAAELTACVRELQDRG